MNIWIYGAVHTGEPGLVVQCLQNKTLKFRSPWQTIRIIYIHGVHCTLLYINHCSQKCRVFRFPPPPPQHIYLILCLTARHPGVVWRRHCTVHCTALHCTALHCTLVHCTALHCSALHCKYVAWMIHWSELFYTFLADPGKARGCSTNIVMNDCQLQI